MIYTKGRVKYHVYKARLKDVISGSDYRYNPMLWWVDRLNYTPDAVVCGVKTRKEALKLAGIK